MQHEGIHRRVMARNRKENSTADRWTKLTPAEIRVAQLTTRGFTNREISEALHIPVSTVEQHLTRTDWVQRSVRVTVPRRLRSFRDRSVWLRA